jgi:hypothetical protein
MTAPVEGSPPAPYATHPHVGSDGFMRRCPYCRGELSPIAYWDLRLSCDGCGELPPCCAAEPEPTRPTR